MHVLLIAYEFPPSPSPQSLRWAYLCRHLARRGCRVTVLTIHLGGKGDGLPSLPPTVQVRRTFAGPARGSLAALRDRRARRSQATGATAVQAAGAAPSRRGWKHRLATTVLDGAGRVVFPDVRGEWKPWAKAELRRLLAEDRPDVVVSSHEPATSLELGLLAAQAGIPWVADLGDPVLAPYTPRHWQARSLALEAEVWRKAAQVTVTTPRAAELLAGRHGPRSGVSVIAQGFEMPAGDAAPPAPLAAGMLDLLYTGSFYAFRRPEALLEALSGFDDVRLHIASISLPDSVLQAARERPGQIRLLGFLGHAEALAAQRKADVLVNIGNADPSQVPGKLFEYFGACRPILHLGDQPDAIGELLGQLKRGWTCANDAAAIAAWLQQIVQAKANGQLEAGLDLGLATVRRWSWQQAAEDYARILHRAVAGTGDAPA